jgi:hypothetical protein
MIHVLWTESLHQGSSMLSQIDDFAVRFPIWIALIAYGATTFLLARRYDLAARWVWSLGCVAYLAHVAFAFEMHHSWSHQAAFQSTLERTESTTGVQTGLGIYLNYLFTLIWIFDAGHWWIAGLKKYHNRPAWILLLLHGFFLFMIINGAIIFAQGPVRWLGIIVVITTLLVPFVRQSASDR